ncbi:MAG: radical SAM protein [Deltaproteobacteria bacterium]|nr:radical SAM protein [Deltaproteobacteria bacterium]
MAEKLMAIWPGKGRFANIVWQVSDVCNYRCSYCNPGNYGGKFRNLDTDRYIETLGSIIDHFKNEGYEGFKIFFSGGEPTVWPPLIPICEFIRAKVDRPLIAINTNLSRPLSWWEKNHHYFHDVVASYHVESADRSRYVENVKFLQYRVSYLACRMLMHDERFAEVVDVGEQLKRELDNYVIEYAHLFNELSPHSEMHHYEEQWKRDFLAQNSYLSKHAVPFSLLDQPKPAYCLELYEGEEPRALNSTRIVSEGKNFFKGWKCWISDALFITTHGDIRLASCNAGKIVGHINDGKVSLSSKPVTCPETRCNCGTDINIPKVRPGKLGAVERLNLG